VEVEARVGVGIRDRRRLSGKLFQSPSLDISEGQQAQWRLRLPPKKLTTGSWVWIIRRSSRSRLHPDKRHVGEEGGGGKGCLQGTKPPYHRVETAVRAGSDSRLVFTGKLNSLPSLLPSRPYPRPPLPLLLLRYGDAHSHIRSPAPAPGHRLACWSYSGMDLARLLIGDVAARPLPSYLP
jgi:hypothetical protein